MVMTRKVPLDSVLSDLGIGWFQFRLWWICGFGFSAAALEVVVMSFVFPELRKAPWNLDEFSLSRLAMTIGCGSIIGETCFGALADRYGRRNVFMTTVVIVVTFGILSAFAPSVHWLALLRFFVGFGYGGNIAVDFTLYSEFLPTAGRGRMLFALAIFWPVGQLFAAILAWYLIPWLGWRSFVAACSIPALITSFARPFIPESPRWLLAKGRVQEATQVCLEIARVNGKSASEVGLGEGCEVCLDNENSSLESAARNESTAASSVDSSLSTTTTVIKEHFGFQLGMVFDDKLKLTTIGLLIVVSSLNFISYGTLTLMPSFLVMKGIPANSVYLSMVCNALAQIPGIGLATAAALYIGRLNPLRLSLFLTGIGLLSFAFAQKPTHVMLCTMMASGCLEAGWALYHVYVPEVYPTDCRAFATGFLSACGSVFSISGPYLCAALMQGRKNPLHVIWAITVVVMFGGICSCVLLSIETKDRDLIDITVTSKGKKSKTKPGLL